MSRYKKALYETFTTMDNKNLFSLKKSLVSDKVDLQKQHDIKYNNTNKYSDKAIIAKISTKTIRIGVIDQILNERLPRFYK